MSLDIRKPEMPRYSKRLTNEVLSCLENAHEAGFSAVTTVGIAQYCGVRPTNGTLNAILWMLQDSGYIFVWSVVTGGKRHHVWSLYDAEPKTEDGLA